MNKNSWLTTGSKWTNFPQSQWNGTKPGNWTNTSTGSFALNSFNTGIPSQTQIIFNKAINADNNQFSSNTQNSRQHSLTIPRDCEPKRTQTQTTFPNTINVDDKKSCSNNQNSRQQSFTIPSIFQEIANPKETNSDGRIKADENESHLNAHDLQQQCLSTGWVSQKQTDLIKIIKSENESSPTIQNSNENSSDSIEINLFSYFRDFPRNFVISVKNTDYMFNRDIMASCSAIIEYQLSMYSNSRQIRVDIDDEFHTMEKIDNLFGLNKIEITRNDLKFIKQITELLNLSIFSNVETFLESTPQCTIQIDTVQFLQFLQQLPHNFSLLINRIKYPCNNIGVYCSKMIENETKGDKESDQISFITDASWDSELMQSFLNFETITIDIHNLSSLQKMSLDFHLDFMQPIFQKFITNCPTFDFNELTNPVSELLTALNEINIRTVPSVVQYLLKSEWVHGEENIREMTSYLIHIIRLKPQLHSQLLDLIVALDKESNETNDLKSFLPFFKQTFYIGRNQIKQNFFNLFKQRNVIPEKQFCNIKPKASLQTNPFENSNNLSKPIQNPQLLSSSHPEVLRGFESHCDFIRQNKCQELKSLSIEKINDQILLALIIYAVDFNSYECFDYLLNLPTRFVSFADISSLFVQLIERDKSEYFEKVFNYLRQRSSSTTSYSYLSHSIQSTSLIYEKPICKAIKLYKDGVIEYFLNKMQICSFSQITPFIQSCAKYGNIRVFFTLLHRSLVLLDMSNTSEDEFFNFLTSNHFYHFLQVGYHIYNKQPIDFKIIDDQQALYKIKSLKLMSLFYNTESVIRSYLYAAIRGNNLEYVEFLLTNFHYYNDKIDFYNLYIESVKSTDSKMFLYILQRMPFESSITYLDLTDYQQILKLACRLTNLVAIEHITNFILTINNKFDFTDEFITALEVPSCKVCKFFIDKKVSLNLDILFESKTISSFDDIAISLFDTLDVQDQKKYFCQLFSSFLSIDNASSISKLLKKKQSIPSEFRALLSEPLRKSPFVQAILTHSIEMLNTFIEYFGDEIANQTKLINFGLKMLLISIISSMKDGPKCHVKMPQDVIQRLSEVAQIDLTCSYGKETFLSVAIQLSDYKFIDFYLKLLTDKSIFNNKSVYSPFELAIPQQSLEVIDMLISYFGDDIQQQKDNIQLSLKQLLEDLSFKQFEEIQPFGKIIKKLSEVVDLGLTMNYYNETFLTIAIKTSDFEFVHFYLNYIKDKSNVKLPFELAIKMQNLELINAFIDFYGEDIVNHTQEIISGFQLLLQDVVRLCFTNNITDIKDDLPKLIGLHSSYKTIKYKLSDIQPKILGTDFVDTIPSINTTIIERLMKIAPLPVDYSCEGETFFSIALKFDVGFIQFYLDSLKNHLIVDNSINKAFTIAIPAANLKTIDALIDYFGDSIVNQVDQIHLGLKLYLDNLYKQSSFSSPIDINIIQRLSEVVSIDFNISSAKDKSFILYAIKSHNIEFIQFYLNDLKKNGEKLPNEISDCSPFILSIVECNLAAVNLFIDHYGSDIVNQTEQVNYALKQLLAKCISFYDDPDHSNQPNPYDCLSLLNVIKRLFEVVTFNLNFYQNSITFLIFAVQHSLVDLVKYFLQIDSVDVNLCELDHGNSPFTLAIINCRNDLINLFFDCPRTDFNYSNYDNETALTLSLQKHQNLEYIPKLIEKVDRDHIDYAFYLSDDTTAPLFISNPCLNVNFTPARQIGFRRFVQSRRHEINSFITIDPCETSLMTSIRLSYIQKAFLIINHPSFDASDATFALFLAAEKKCFDIFSRLLDFFDVNKVSRNNQSLLSYCYSINCIHGVQLIFDDKNFVPGNSIVSLVYESLHPFSSSGVEKLGQIDFSSFDFLIKTDQERFHTINMNKPLLNGQTVFTSITHSFVHREMEKLIELLLKYGADPNQPDGNGIYPFQHAISIQSENMIRALIQSGKIDLTTRIKTNGCPGYTYLHLAVFSIIQIFKLIFETRKIDINSTDDLGDTPIMLAIRIENEYQEKKRSSDLQQQDRLAEIIDFLSIYSKELPARKKKSAWRTSNTRSPWVTWT